MNNFKEEFESISKYAKRVGISPKAILKRIYEGKFFKNGEVFQLHSKRYTIKISASEREISTVDNFKS